MSLEQLTKWKEGGKVAALFCACLLMGVVTTTLVVQPKAIGSAVAPLLSETTGTVKDIHASVSTIKDLTAEIKKDYENNQDNMAANSEAAAVLLNQTSQTMLNLNTQLFGGQDCKQLAEKLANGWHKLNCQDVAGILPQANLILANFNGWMLQMQSDTHDLEVALTGVLNGVDAKVLSPLLLNLQKMATLEDTLNQEILSGSTHAKETFDKLNQTIDDVNKLLEDPNIQQTLANVQKTTFHIGETAQSVDDATRWMREKIGRVKMALKTIASIVGKIAIRVN